MRIGALRIELFISNAGSLKHKRAVIKSIKDRIAAGFNVSVAEVGSLDKWQKAEIGVAAAGNDSRYLNGQLDKVLDCVRGYGDVQIVDYEMEII